jgi:hypothetical protein
MSLTIACPKHPRYTGRRRPKGKCATCWELHRVATSVYVGNLTRRIKRFPGDVLNTGLIKDDASQDVVLTYKTPLEMLRPSAKLRGQYAFTPPAPDKPAPLAHPSSSRRQRLFGLLSELPQPPRLPRPLHHEPRRSPSRRKPAKP